MQLLSEAILTAFFKLHKVYLANYKIKKLQLLF